MSTPFVMAPKRRNPFAPFDSENAMPDDALYQPGPSLGPAGAPPPPEQFGPNAPSLYTPAPTGPMPDFASATPDITQSATIPKIPQARAPQQSDQSLYAPAGGQEQAPQVGGDLYQRLGVKPPRVYRANDPEVQSQLSWWQKNTPGVANTLAAGMTRQEQDRTRMEMTAAANLQYHDLQAQFFKNQDRFATPYPVEGPDKKPRWQTHHMGTGQVLDLGPVAEKDDTPFGIWHRQNPNAPISEWFKIQPAVQSTTIRAEMPPKEPTPSFSQADVKLKDGTSIPGSFNAHSGKYYDASGQEIPPDQIAGATRVGGANIFTPDDAKSIADAIEQGKQPPNVRGLYRNAAPVRAELARRGYDLSHAEMDWDATKRFLSTLNNPQQVRLRQAITFARDSVPLIDGLYDHLNELAPRSGFRIINKATIAAMKQLPGDAGATAQALETQLNHLTAELGNIYMGGNTPTDMSLRLGQNAMEKDWNIETWKKNRDLLMKNLDIRANSIATSSAQGVTPGSPYAPKGIVPQGAPGGAEADTPASVKADFKAGKITREQAKQKLEALGIK